MQENIILTKLVEGSTKEILRLKNELRKSEYTANSYKPEMLKYVTANSIIRIS